ncbi:protein translocase subunit SecDF [Brumimicrobium aurantiacum]|uniref:Multifunctional fusion protein n=1 Tax=Brumimicrobium aurantiacum TaxID=1737063 RepID=A0A3E1F0E8_9FLAO|nr:protein translocase subunit SecDF [Brumimicrobium aurantiacum]RFC55278.1 protein translocase subunit SecDF [Brumimicrobium aurantiacum]
MRNKGFFWFFTILLLVVSIYQISFSFIGGGIEKEAEVLATERVEALKASANGDSVKLPNGTFVNFSTNNEAEALAKAAFINEILKEKNEEEVFLGNTFNEVKGKSVSLGLDLEGGMSVTLELSMSDLVQNAALNPRDLHFKKPYESALEEFNAQGGDFIDIFVAKHQEMYPDRLLIREFSTDDVVSKITNKATDEETKEYLRSLSEGALDGVETIMENRINQFGVAQPNITKDDNANRLYIELPGVKDQATVRERLQSTANLEFYLAYKGQELGGFFNELLIERSDDVSDDEFEDLFSEEEDTTVTEDVAETTEEDTTEMSLEEELGMENDAEEDTSFRLSDFGKMFQVNIDAENRFQNSPRLGFSKSSDTSKVNKILNEKAEEMMLENIRFVWGAKSDNIGVSDTLYYTLYAMKIPQDLKARVGGTDIENARLSFDPNQSDRGVSIDMSDRGAEEWGKMTSENVGNFIAITMDNKVYSAPIINGAITGGQTLISGDFTVAEAQNLTNLLNAGALPAPCIIVDEAVVGPTIGEENSRSGLISFAFALALVLIYMVFYYGRAGLVADIALIMNIVLIVGFLAAFGAVLTLAGIAGIVLTIGMSVDANVLIFERVREEIREGKGMKLAIKDGYSNALSSIIDANVTTLLVAIVLKTFGTGPIESFATTLIIGIFTSVFAAVVITRLIFESQVSKNKGFAFTTSISKNAFTNINLGFIKNRKKFYIVSGIFVLAGIIAISTRGLKPSVEFAGGRTYETVFEKPVGQNVEELTEVIRNTLVVDESKASVEVKVRNSDYRVEIATDYLQNVPNSEADVRKDLLAALASVEDDYGVATIENSRSVSPTVSEELQKSSSIAIILSLIIIFVYILIRFGKWQYGLGAIVAMSHDVIIVLGLFAMLHGILPFNMEVDQAFIAAILTVVGYSINDTVVVFDRIREFLNKYRRKSQNDIINDAINSTLGRTINTSLSTFIVLLTIFIFDGGAIKGFVFALMIGVIVGTYSSVCVATPIVADLLKKKKNDEITEA